jgi:hypothetical protein
MTERSLAAGRRWVAMTIVVGMVGGSFLLSGSAGRIQPAIAEPLYAQRQNAGGSAFVDGTGATWEADAAYTTANTFGFIGGTAFSTASPIAGTLDDALYRSSRSGSSFTYRFDVPAGTYTVLLKFAEIDPNRAAVGRRVFNVTVENTQVLTNFDVYAQAGANTALDRSFSTTVGDGALGIRFSGVTGGATVSAVQVISAEQVPEPDFSLEVTPTSQTLGPGGSASYTVEVAFLNGFTSTNVNLSVGGLPSGVTGAFTPNPLTHEGRSVLALRGDQTVVPGTYTLVTRATAEGMTRTRNVTLVVSTSPDFAMSMSPTTQSVAAGAAATYRVSVTSINGSADPVRFSVSGLPSGVTSAFSPHPATPPVDVSLRISTASTTPGGEHAFTVTGTDGTRTHSLTGMMVVAAPGSAWGVSVIGSTGSANNSVVVGPGRNDGVNRVYVGTVSTGSVMELSWNGTAWTSPVRAGGSPSGGGEIHNLGMGPGRNDGVVRIYACHDAGPLFELTYDGTRWSQTTMGAISGSCTHAAVGRGRNDGINRVYATRGADLWEYTWTGSGWSSLQIGQVSSGILHGLALGSARGGTAVQVYVASTDNGTYEARFTNGAWSMLPMGDSGDVRNVSVGAGRNDGIMRVYAATRDGVIREFTRTSTTWTFTQINTAIGNHPMVHAYVVDGRNDSVMRVYGASGNGNAYEFTWNGSGWVSATLGGGADYLYGFHVGRTRDGRNRLYGSNFGSEVLEFSFR